MPNLPSLRALDSLRRRLGLDRAIAASTLTQLMRFVTGPVTIFLIIRYLSPEEQGFSYSFGSVVGIQVFLEAGFAQSITQFASKEFASLRFNRNGLLTGSVDALSRLRSIIQKANRYYTVMAAALTILLAVGGYFFFSSKPDHDVPWVFSWIIISICTGLGFILTPVWAFLEGCNRVAEVAMYRLWSTLAGFGSMAIGLILGLGIHVTALTAVVSLVFPVIFIWFRWRKLIAQILRPAGKSQVSWGKEIWGFQWRIALTWGFKYLLFPFTPALAFALSGPVASGKIGLCYQLAFMGSVLGTVWTVTKVPGWGSLVAQGKLSLFEQEWKTASLKHVGVALVTQVGTLTVLLIIQLLDLGFSERFLHPAAYGGFALGILFHSFWLVFSHYFRAKREEPFVLISGIAAAAYLAVALLATPWGEDGITYSFAAANLLGALGSYLIWKKLK